MAIMLLRQSIPQSICAGASSSLFFFHEAAKLFVNA
jgi:hypothetical protein